MVLDIIKKAIWIITLLPTVFALIYGSLLAIGWPPQVRSTFGMTELVSLVVFCVFVAFGTIYCLSYISVKIYERCTGKKIQGVSQTRKFEEKVGNKIEEKVGNKVSVNINISSSDFVDKDAEQTKVFLNGVSNIIKESGSNAEEKPNTKDTSKETKRDSKT
jgi:hypothetical protein